LGFSPTLGKGPAEFHRATDPEAQPTGKERARRDVILREAKPSGGSDDHPGTTALAAVRALIVNVILSE